MFLRIVGIVYVHLIAQFNSGGVEDGSLEFSAQHESDVADDELGAGGFCRLLICHVLSR